MKVNPKVFVVEDDKVYQRYLQYVLEMNPDLEVQAFSSGKELLKHLREKPTIITLDYHLPDTSGLELLKHVRSSSPQTKVIALSGQEAIATAVEMLKHGAYDYIVKSNDIQQRLLNTVNHILHSSQLEQRVEQLEQRLEEKFDLKSHFIGTSKVMKQVYTTLQKALNNNISVTISGETGTGKELAAQTIHYSSNRSKGPFVPVNVAAMPKDLMESELFGHEKGSFTGAVTRRLGKFEEAAGGTLFLDEIGEMPLPMQAKLLRVLQEREINRVGSNNTIKIDFRLVVATHRDLFQEVASGNFREDLYYRLLGLTVHLPPLRDRGNDILLLAKEFLDSFCKENSLGKKQLATATKERLLTYRFPGNVRELKSMMEMAAVMADSDHIEPEHLRFQHSNSMESLILEELTLREYNHRIVQHFLDKYGQNVLMVADKLQVGKSTLYRMLKEMEV